MNNFIGRNTELNQIKKVLKNISSSIMIYGKRKVGKTTLILEAIKDSNNLTVYYECIKAPIQDNINLFIKELVRKKIISVNISFNSFIDVFAYLDSLNIPLNIIIDEYPYLKTNADSQKTDSEFQSIIDNHIKNIHLFISGSHIGIMKDMLNENNALYGRFSLILQLKELNYREAAEFYNQKSVYDKIAFYSVFGGSPFINEFINPNLSLKENIINTVLNSHNPVFNYTEHLLITDYTKAVNAERILHSLSNGKKKYGEIESMLNIKSNGLLSKQLDFLINMEIVTKNYPINKPNDNKKIFYELNDNILRFYYTFIHKNKSALTVLGATAFYEEYIEKSILTFISHRFEDICRTYFSIKVKSGELSGITNIGTYYYDDSKTKTNGEFDVALARHGIYDIFEVKYLSTPLSLKTVNEEAEKINNIKGLTVNNIGFISVNGFEKKENNYIYVVGEDLFS